MGHPDHYASRTLVAMKVNGQLFAPFDGREKAVQHILSAEDNRTSPSLNLLSNRKL